jgi:hypothetical protein
MIVCSVQKMPGLRGFQPVQVDVYELRFWFMAIIYWHAVPLFQGKRGTYDAPLDAESTRKPL